MRAFHIAQTGCDAAIVGPYKRSSLTKTAVLKSAPVSGALKICGNLYYMSQILAWLAKDRRDLQEQIEWREQISELMEPLMN